jgi:capsular polysaccharide transport system permease protein
MSAAAVRSPYQIATAVWKALFLREALGRLFAARAAWFWLLAEPVFHVSYMLVIFTAIRVQHVGGIETPIWLMTGLLAFFMFRQTGTQGANGINANRSLFIYRQVKPVDTVLVRSALEAVLLLCVMVIMLAGLWLLNWNPLPADPLTVLQAFFALWLLGLSYGLISSVVSELVPELDRILDFAMMPLYLISGVVFPLSAVPQPYRDWVMLNPVAHGVEAVRQGFSPYYHAVPELSQPYLWACVLIVFFVGLVLHRRFAQRLVTA